jgi:uncharacterized protein
VNIEVFHSLAPRQISVVAAELNAGASVAQALDAVAQHAGWSALAQAARAQQLSLSVWGRRVGLDEVLHEGDRLELCRGLLVDPKVARRERFKAQGSKSAGLFSKRRPGAKAGY